MNAELRKPEVAVIQTGGTIAMTSGLSGRNLSIQGEKAVSSAVDQIADELGINVVSITSPFMMDSSNMTPREWQSLSRHVKRILTPTLDGVVITHGTDTLEYTSSALSFAFPRITFPIVLVGAMRDSADPFADGPYQLKDALFVAAYSDLAGVYTVMDSQVHDGTHVKKTSVEDEPVSLQHFASINKLPIGYVVRANRMEFHHLLSSHYNFRREYKESDTYTNFDEGGKVISYHILPGISTQYLYPSLEVGAKVIILSLYTEDFGGDVLQSLMGLTQEAVRRKIAVFATTEGGTMDLEKTESAIALRKKGLIPLFDMLPTTSLVKANWALQNPTPTENPEVIVRRMLTNSAGEFRTRIPEDLINNFCLPYSM